VDFAAQVVTISERSQTMQKKLLMRVMSCVGQWAKHRVHLLQVVEPLKMLEDKTFDQWSHLLFESYHCPFSNVPLTTLKASSSRFMSTYMDTLPGTTNKSMPNTEDGDGDSEATWK
jgi:hypothetical protein